MLLKHAKSEIFTFNFIYLDEIEQKILKYNSNKASTEQNVPLNVFNLLDGQVEKLNNLIC